MVLELIGMAGEYTAELYYNILAWGEYIKGTSIDPCNIPKKLKTLVKN